MQAVDLQDRVGEFIFDKGRKIPKAHLNSVCRIHQGAGTCRYISLGLKGFVCAKHTRMKPVMDSFVNEGKMSAKGDNCEGLGSLVVLDPQSPPQASTRLNSGEEEVREGKAGSEGA